ncbi:hypothetical protein [Streptomyces sp. NPDC040750]|uniref:hypothetical protein n=1 Tax=Streptomyces sp. NPDC040750 TaxID=3154491 RepID=UPI0033DCC216
MAELLGDHGEARTYLPVSDGDERSEQALAVAAFLVEEPSDDALVIAVEAGQPRGSPAGPCPQPPRFVTDTCTGAAAVRGRLARRHRDGLWRHVLVWSREAEPSLGSRREISEARATSTITAIHRSALLEAATRSGEGTAAEGLARVS